MKLPGGFVLLILLSACSKPGSNENQLAVTDQPDTTASAVSPRNPGDPVSYIGYIEKFEDNKSFYTDLYFVDGFDYGLYDEIAKMGKVIFKDGESTRTRIEIKKAQQYFKLTGLDTITIYTWDNQRLTAGRISHIEYIEGPIENSFVAVFDVTNPDISDYMFCIGNMRGELSPVKVSLHEDDELNADLMNNLQLNKDLVWDISHYRLDDQTTYSTVSADTTAFIVETTVKPYKTIYKSKSSELISQLTIISKKINGRPIFLTICGMPETDMGWSSVLTFNGTEYEISKDHRIKN